MNLGDARLGLAFILSLVWAVASAQVVVRGQVSDEIGEPLIGASVLVLGPMTGNVTDFDGNFEVEVPEIPARLVVSYIGYAADTVVVENVEQVIDVTLGDNATTMVTVEVKGRRISEKRQQSALTMETLDNIAIKETPAANFYDGLGALKDVDLTAASLGFKIINTRGFNSTNPVRSLQIIDGVDNQSPGLNFSLGNFLGASDLDVNSVNIIVGASSAFYGPNAFNGVIAMETKDPFLQQGLSATIKGGERNLIEGGFRWAQALENGDGEEVFAYKLNAYGFRADDWVADNYDPVFDTETGRDNPGGYDAVNIYGDEYNSLFDRSDNIQNTPGLGIFYRDGYREIDLVDYDSYNVKLNGQAQWRLKPKDGLLSPELLAASSYSRGTTIYQGDNRFSLRNIQFYQHKIELRKRNHYFLRAYLTHEDAGDSYDPYFTALQLQEQSATDRQWAQRYSNYWSIGPDAIRRRIQNTEGFPNAVDFLGEPEAYRAAISSFLGGIQDSLFAYHAEASAAANSASPTNNTEARLEPGTPEFEAAFEDITSRIAFSEGGTRFFDRSALVHVHGEYLFKDLQPEGTALSNLDLRLGANFRNYMPNSRGSILSDTSGRNIDTYEYGVYGGGEATFSGRYRVSGSVRLDKNENFDYLVSPAASFLYLPNETTTLRLSFSSAIRNPTLADQYLFYDVGPATLLGNLSGYEGLFEPESFIDYSNTLDLSLLDTISIAPIRPERVRTFEVGARTTLFDRLYLDATYYYSFYRDFIGFNFAVDAAFDPVTNLPGGVEVFRIAANAQDEVTTQGFSIGSSYYFGDYFVVNGNYSWNVLNTATDDPIVPAFNTPKHKFNLGFSGRDIPFEVASTSLPIGFNINYKWVQGFIFEGSPQFTGFIPTYALLDAQANVTFPSLHTTLKVGASNVLDNQVFLTYGGPRIGRLAYASLTYDFRQ